jgi:hypothetical protein
MNREPWKRSGRRGIKRQLRWTWCVVAAGLVSGCGGMGGAVDSVADTGAGIGSRFKQLFAGSSQPAGETSNPAPTANSELSCPPLSIRNGASTYAVGLPGKPATGPDVRFQVTITNTARDCTLAGDQITARIGIEGRVIVGPAGAPPTVDIPLRVAVVQETTAGTKPIFTKLYRTSVTMPADGGNTTYSFVAEDVDYPVPSSRANPYYIYYIGFDPNGLKPEPATRPGRRAKPSG